MTPVLMNMLFASIESPRGNPLSLLKPRYRWRSEKLKAMRHSFDLSDAERPIPEHGRFRFDLRRENTFTTDRESPFSDSEWISRSTAYLSDFQCCQRRQTPYNGLTTVRDRVAAICRNTPQSHGESLIRYATPFRNFIIFKSAFLYRSICIAIIHLTSQYRTPFSER